MVESKLYIDIDIYPCINQLTFSDISHVWTWIYKYIQIRNIYTQGPHPTHAHTHTHTQHTYTHTYIYIYPLISQLTSHFYYVARLFTHFAKLFHYEMNILILNIFLWRKYFPPIVLNITLYIYIYIYIWERLFMFVFVFMLNWLNCSFSFFFAVRWCESGTECIFFFSYLCFKGIIF